MAAYVRNYVKEIVYSPYLWQLEKSGTYNMKFSMIDFRVTPRFHSEFNHNVASGHFLIKSQRQCGQFVFSYFQLMAAHKMMSFSVVSISPIRLRVCNDPIHNARI